MKLLLLVLSISFITGCATPTPTPTPSHFIDNKGKTAINPEYVSFLLKKQLPNFRQCFIKNHPAIHTTVRVDMQFKVSDNGNASDINITSKAIKAPVVFDCMKNILSEIHYPATGNGVDVIFIQPFDFKTY